ncbi:MAG: hypothetical protein Q9228_007878 [Teloschistes exilis]
MEMITGQRPDMAYLEKKLDRSRSAISAHAKIIKDKAKAAHKDRELKAKPATCPTDPVETIEAAEIYEAKSRAPRQPKNETAAKKVGKDALKLVSLKRGAKRGHDEDNDSNAPLTKRARDTVPEIAKAPKINPEEPYDPVSVLQRAKVNYLEMADTPLTTDQVTELKEARAKKAKKTE